MFRYLLLLYFVIGFLFPTQSFGDSVNIKVGSKVSHIVGGEWNEDNRLIGIEYQFSCYCGNDTVIVIANHPTNSENILSKPLKLLLTYEE